MVLVKFLQLELEPYYFSNAWTKDNTFEAIVSVGITPGINPSAVEKEYTYFIAHSR